MLCRVVIFVATVFIAVAYILPINRVSKNLFATPESDKYDRVVDLVERLAKSQKSQQEETNIQIKSLTKSQEETNVQISNLSKEISKLSTELSKTDVRLNELMGYT